MNDRQIIDTAVASDLGDNANRLHELIQTKKKSVFVDIGVRAGMSSGIMGLRSKENGNKVYGAGALQISYFMTHTGLKDNMQSSMVSPGRGLMKPSVNSLVSILSETMRMTISR